MLDTVVAAETPEGIVLELHPAGLPARFYAFVLDWLIRLVVAHPIDKTNLHALRLLHFLALALLVLRVFPRHWPVLTSPALRPAILCGRHSLETFCLGTFLAFAGHFAIVEIAHGIGAQIVISSLGIALMVGLAGLIDWYQAAEASARHAPLGVAPANPRRERPAQSVAMVLFHRIRIARPPEHRAARER